MMKHVLVALAAFPMLAGASDLDLAPGTLELTGTSSLGLSSGSREVKVAGTTSSSDHTAFGVGTSGLYYVLPNLGVGVQAGYGYSKTESDGFDRMSSVVSAVSVGPIVSYQVPVAPQLAAFGRAGASYLRGTLEQSSSGVPQGFSDTHTISGYGFGLQAGLKYFPATAVSLDAGLGWSWLTEEQDTTPETTFTRSGIALSVGVSVYFGGGR